MKNFGPKVQSLIKAVFEAGEKVKRIPRIFEVKKGESHRSGVTQGDKLSQDIIVKRLTEEIEGVRILCEEESNHKSVLSKDNPLGLFEGTRVIIDPIDSTLNYGEDAADWSVGAGLMEDGVLRGTAIYAPAFNNGLIIAAEADRGVAKLDWGDVKHCDCPPKKREPQKCVVRVGVDTLLYPSFAQTIPIIGANVRGVLTMGSGLLGLGLMACGQVQAIIQTPQKAWDWAPAYAAASLGGNTFRFFQISEGGELVPVKEYDYEAFCFLPKTNRLGFVAGQPSLVDKIWDILPKAGWSRLNPDTISGTWN